MMFSWRDGTQQADRDGRDALANVAPQRGTQQKQIGNPPLSTWVPATERSQATEPGMMMPQASEADRARLPVPLWQLAQKQPKSLGGAACTLSVDRYLDLMQMLTGSDGRRPAVVKRLTKLESGTITMADLRAVLAANGCAVGPRSAVKQELIALMQGMQLATPVCIMDDAGPAGPASLDQRMLQALGWTSPVPTADAVSAAVSKSGYYSYCALPQVTIKDWQQCTPEQEMAAMDAPPSPAVQPASDSQTTTVGSRPAVQQAWCIQESPAPPEQGPGMQSSDEDEAASEEAASADKPADDVIFAEQWLVEGVRMVAAASQASADEAAGRQLVGRKVAVVLVRAFDHGGDGGDGFVDSLECGVHVGLVVEFIGGVHDEDACARDCSQEHGFCYVRVPCSHSTAPRARWGRRRLDVVRDLHGRLRAGSLDALLCMEESELGEAWVLLEPRDKDEEPL